MIENIKAINTRIDEIQKGFSNLGYGSPIDSRVKSFAVYMQEANSETNKVATNNGINNITNTNGIEKYTIDMINNDIEQAGLNNNTISLNKGYEVYKNTGESFPTKYDSIIEEASKLYNVPEALIKSVIKQESNFNADAISKRGAMGLMQLMPSTASELGIPLETLTDAKTNVFGGTKYLSDMLSKYNGRVDLALAAYNAGPNAVDNAKGVPNIEETQDYVKKILRYLM